MWDRKVGEHLYEEKTIRVRMTMGAESRQHGIFGGQRAKHTVDLTN